MVNENDIFCVCVRVCAFLYCLLEKQKVSIIQWMTYKTPQKAHIHILISSVLKETIGECSCIVLNSGENMFVKKKKKQLNLEGEKTTSGSTQLCNSNYAASHILCMSFLLFYFWMLLILFSR